MAGEGEMKRRRDDGAEPQMRELTQLDEACDLVAQRVKAVRVAALQGVEKRESAAERKIAAREEAVARRERAVEEERGALEAEKQRMEGLHKFHASPVVVDVGGERFKTTLSTLTAVPGSMLASMFSGRWKLSPADDGSYFIDRDPKWFQYIINSLRDGGQPQPTPGAQCALEELRKQAEFYGVAEQVVPGYEGTIEDKVRRELKKRLTKKLATGGVHCPRWAPLAHGEVAGGGIWSGVPEEAARARAEELVDSVNERNIEYYLGNLRVNDLTKMMQDPSYMNTALFTLHWEPAVGRHPDRSFPLGRPDLDFPER